MFIEAYQYFHCEKEKIFMRKRFLTLLFALLMCISMTITVYAAPQTDQSHSQTQFTTNATPAELSIIKTLFYAQDYAELYPDVVEAYGNEEAALWNHFVNHGLSEGRSLSKNFHVFAYRAAYADLQEAFGNNLIAYYIHYATHGMQENRSITTVDQAVKAGLTVTGLRGQIIAKPIPVITISEEDQTPEFSPEPSAAPAENTDYEEVTPSEPAPEPPCTHQYDVKQIENTLTHAPVCSSCGYIDETQKEACTAGDSYEVTKTTHEQKCQKCNGIMTTESHNFSYGSVCLICNYDCTHIWGEWSHDSTEHSHRCLLCKWSEHDPHSWENGICTICGYGS